MLNTRATKITLCCTQSRDVELWGKSYRAALQGQQKEVFKKPLEHGSKVWQFISKRKAKHCSAERLLWALRFWVLYKEGNVPLGTGQGKHPKYCDPGWNKQGKYFMFSFLKEKPFFECWEENWSTEIHKCSWMATHPLAPSDFGSSQPYPKYYLHHKLGLRNFFKTQNGNSVELPASDWAKHEPTCFTLSMAVIQLSQKLVEVILMSNPVVL